MRSLRLFVFGSFLLVVFCSTMVVRQFIINHSRHAEIREAFILLYTKGYITEAQTLYHRLLLELQDVPQNDLIEDIQRTSMLVKPAESQTDNLVWRYHWSAVQELEKRASTDLAKALEIANKSK